MESLTFFQPKFMGKLAALMGGVGLLVSSCQSLEGQLSSVSPPPAQSAPSQTGRPLASVSYESHTLDRAIAHVVRIPLGEHYRITPVVAPDLETLERLAQQSGAIAAINGGYFDPQNQQTTSYITIDGTLVADPRQNLRLMENPDLSPYLPRILDRSEFRRYHCETGRQYGVARHTAPTPAGCRLVDAVGAGPQILPELLATEEAFVERNADEVVRDAIGSYGPNARSAIGITATGEVLLVMVAQDRETGSPQGSNRPGLSLPELANFMAAQGVQVAINLDGGSSASLYYRGSTYLGRLDDAGRPIERPVKSALLVLPGDPMSSEPP